MGKKILSLALAFSMIMSLFIGAPLKASALPTPTSVTFSDGDLDRIYFKGDTLTFNLAGLPVGSPPTALPAGTTLRVAMGIVSSSGTFSDFTLFSDLSNGMGDGTGWYRTCTLQADGTLSSAITGSIVTSVTPTMGVVAVKLYANNGSSWVNILAGKPAEFISLSADSKDAMVGLDNVIVLPSGVTSSPVIGAGAQNVEDLRSMDISFTKEISSGISGTIAFTGLDLITNKAYLELLNDGLVMQNVATPATGKLSQYLLGVNTDTLSFLSGLGASVSVTSTSFLGYKTSDFEAAPDGVTGGIVSGLSFDNSTYTINFSVNHFSTYKVSVKDTDGDGIPDSKDNAPTIANPDQADADGDGIGDVADNAPYIANADQKDSDGDGIGDVADPTPYGDFKGQFNIESETGTGSGWGYSSSTLTITENGDYRVYGTGVENGRRINVNSGLTVKITLENVNAGVFCLQGTANATIILKDGSTNTFRGGSYSSAVNVPSTASLTISGGTLGTGKLNANGGNGGYSGYGAAGIGGSHNQDAGTIVINGGVITASGGSDTSGPGAGIGGGGTSGTTLSGGSITINGGTVKACGGVQWGYGSLHAPAIGGYSPGTVTINGGNITACGSDYAISCSTLAIDDAATVFAYSAKAGASPFYGNAASSGHSAYLLSFSLNAAVGSDTEITIARKGSDAETFKVTLPSGYRNFSTTVSSANSYNATVNSGAKRIFKVSDDSQDFDGVLTAGSAAIEAYSAKLIDYIPLAKIGSVEYLTLAAALKAVTDGQTIKLLDDIDYTNEISTSDKSFTIDLDNNTLEVSVGASNGISTSNGKSISIIGGGGLYVYVNASGSTTSSWSALSANGSGGKIEIDDSVYVDIETNGNYNIGVYASDGARVKLKANVTVADTPQSLGVYAIGSGSTIEIEGNVTGGWTAVHASTGSEIKVTGNVTCTIVNGYGLYSKASKVSITGNVSATGGGNYGVFMENAGIVSVSGNITSDSVGVSAFTGSTLTVDGKVTAVYYFLQIGSIGNYMNMSQYAPTTTKEGYLTFTDGTSTVWLKAVYWTDGISSSDQYTFGGGDGSSREAAYEISTAGQLSQLAYNVNNGTNYSGKYFKLTADINLSARQWMPIGKTYSYGFYGYFDGNGHSISGMTMTKVSGSEAYGLFGVTGSSATIDNVTIESGTISFNETAGYNYFGGIVGYNHGLIKNCTNKIDIDTSSSDWSYAGGIAGIGNCDTWSYAYTGRISDCRNEGDISIGPSGYVGGIVGSQLNSISSTYIKNCSNTGNITGGKYAEAGGIAGRINNAGTDGITNCYNKGNVTSGASDSTYCYAGGIVGYQYYSRVKNCYNTGSVTLLYQSGPGNTAAGGITGYSESYGPTYNCYNVGTVTGPVRNGMGISGSGTFCENCYYLDTSTTSGAITGTTSLTANQMKGLAASTITISYITTDNKITSGPSAGTFIYALDKGRYESSEYPDGFYNWASDDLGVNGGYPVFSSVHSYYIVSFEAAGGSLIAAKTLVPASSISSEPSTSRTGYTFDGWFDAASGGNKITFPYTPTASVILYAHWTQLPFTVTFDAKGGSAVEAKTITAGGNIPEEPVTTKSGCTFEGWYITETGGKRVKFPYTPTASITLYAHWSQASYTVTFDAKGGSAVEAKTITAGGNIPTEPVTTKSGFTFDGWYITETDGKKVAFPYTPLESVTLYAHWTEVPSGGGGGGGGRTPTGEQVDIKSTDGSRGVQGTLTTTDGKETITIGSTQFNELSGAGKGAIIPLPSVTVTFDKKAMDTIRGASASGDVVVSVETVPPSKLTAEQRKRVGDRPVYDFSVTKGGVTVSHFVGGKATISIPYTLKAGENPNSVVVYYLTDSGALVSVRGRYDSSTGKVTFTTNHFSKYVIGYNTASFTDVSESAWYYKAIGFIAARGITTGTGNGLFAPEDTLTRGQFIVMLMRAYGIELQQGLSDNFADAGNDYYTPYLATAKKLGITKGVGDNKYAPDAQISREDLFTLLYRTLEILGELPSGDIGKKLSEFSDSDSISEYAKTAMSSFVASGIISGSGGKLNPSGISTRAEMAQVLYNLLSK